MSFCQMGGGEGGIKIKGLDEDHQTLSVLTLRLGYNLPRIIAKVLRKGSAAPHSN